jgi:hypothetical protein
MAGQSKEWDFLTNAIGEYLNGKEACAPYYSGD